MTVKELLSKKGGEIISLESDNTVESAIRTLNNRNISAVIVTDSGKTTGIFTERDVVKCYVKHEGKSFSDIKLADTVTKDLIVAEADEDIADVMWVMIEKNIRHIPVVDGGKIIGILSIRDLLKTQLSKLEAEIHYLKDYIAGANY